MNLKLTVSRYFFRRVYRTRYFFEKVSVSRYILKVSLTGLFKVCIKVECEMFQLTIENLDTDVVMLMVSNLQRMYDTEFNTYLYSCDI